MRALKTTNSVVATSPEPYYPWSDTNCFVKGSNQDHSISPGFCYAVFARLQLLLPNPGELMRKSVKKSSGEREARARQLRSPCWCQKKHSRCL